MPDCVCTCVSVDGTFKMHSFKFHRVFCRFFFIWLLLLAFFFTLSLSLSSTLGLYLILFQLTVYKIRKCTNERTANKNKIGISNCQASNRTACTAFLTINRIRYTIWWQYMRIILICGVFFLRQKHTRMLDITLKCMRTCRQQNFA